MKPLRSTQPLSSILNPARPYTNAAQTDLAATFERVRRQQAEQAQRTPLLSFKKNRGA